MKTSSVSKLARIGLSAVIGSLGLALGAHADVIASWTFPAADTESGPVAPTSTDANASVTSVSVTGMTYDDNDSDNYFVSRSQALVFAGSGDTPSTPDSGKYVSFGVQANAGYALDLTTLEFFASIQDTDDGTVDVQYSTDNWATATDLGTSTLTGNPNNVGHDITLNVDLDDVTNAQFRFYYARGTDGSSNSYDVAALGNATFGDPGLILSGDSFLLSDDVPEPSAPALLLGGIALMAITVRRRASRQLSLPI